MYFETMRKYIQGTLEQYSEERPDPNGLSTYLVSATSSHRIED